jgi:hypothetical protein
MDRWRIVVVALAACGPVAQPTRARPTPVPLGREAVAPVPVDDATTEARVFDTPMPAEGYLAAPSQSQRRARVAFHGRLFAAEPAAASQPLTGAERTPVDPTEVLPLVEERPGSVRVLIEESGIRLVAYLLHDDLVPVVRRRTRASLDQHAASASGEDGVWLRPGVACSRHPGMERIAQIDDPIYQGSARVERRAVDWAFEVEPEPPSRATARIPAGTAITDRGGRLLLRAREGVYVSELAHDGGRSRVRYASEQLWIEGWVDSAALAREDEPEVFGLGGIGGWGTSGALRQLHAGDRLHGVAGGEAIGLVLNERVRAMDGVEHEGGRNVTIYLGSWGFVDVWLTAADADFGDRWEKVFLGRARLEPLPKQPLPWEITYHHEGAATCWHEALGRGARTLLALRLTWKGGDRVEIQPAANLDAELSRCLLEAFDLRHHKPAQPPPLSFTLQLRPATLPARP